MSWRLRVRALLAPRKVERELDDELAFHVEMEARKQIAAGLSPADARPMLASVAWTPPTLAGNRLYLRDRRGIMALDISTIR